MSHRHSDVAPEPRPPNAGTADPGPARRRDRSKDGSFSGADRPEKTMEDWKKLEETLDAYVDRELSAEAATEVEAHIAECSSCRRAVEGFARLREAVRAAAGKPEVPQQLLARVRGSLSPRWHRAVAIQAIAATLVLAAVLTLFVPSVRAAAATAPGFFSFKLYDFPAVVLVRKMLCL